MHIYNTLLCIIFPLHEITKKNSIHCSEGVSNIASMGVMINLTLLFFSDCRYQSLSIFFLSLKDMKTHIMKQIYLM